MAKEKIKVVSIFDEFPPSFLAMVGLTHLDIQILQGKRRYRQDFVEGGNTELLPFRRRLRRRLLRTLTLAWTGR